MEINIFYAFLSVFTISAISLVGLFTILLHERKLRGIIFLLVALAIGGLLGDAFLHLIPEAMEKSGNSPVIALLVITGMILFFIFEKIIGWHHHHHEKAGEHKEERHIKPLGKLILISDGLHNFIDGIIIGVSYLVSIELGIASTLAIILHEIPQEVGDFGVLLYAGYSKIKAFLYNFLSALFAIVGVILVVLIGEAVHSITIWILPIAAGNFIYIASSDLFPELHKEHNVVKLILEVSIIVVGVAAMYGLLFFE